MSVAIVFSPAAKTDVSDIWHYSVTEWGENQAELYILELESACTKLANGLNFETIADYIKPGYRKALVGKHVIYFTRQEHEITVVRILHQSMDVDEI